ncbi:MAG: CsbD family protein [Acetobacteraceae bacterium]
MVDQNRVEGAFDQAKGAVKEGAGKLVGDQKLQAEGQADKVKGKAESAVGGAKDTVRDAADKL